MKKVLKWVLILTLIGGVAIGGIGYYKYQKATSKIYSENGSYNRRSDLRTHKNKPVAYLLLGTDTGALGRTEKGRTDTIMVMVINPGKKTTTLVSVERDIKIDIGGRPAKLNAAYEMGDADAAIEEVNELLDIQLDGYILVNMNGIQALVDAVGGIDVVSPMTFSAGGFDFQQGQTVHMNGEQALAFSRMRYSDPRGNYGRQERQMQIIQAVGTKVRHNPLNLLSDQFLEAIGDSVRSDISPTSMRRLATGYSAAGENFASDQIHGDGIMENGVSYQVVAQSEYDRVHNVIEEALAE